MEGLLPNKEPNKDFLDRSFKEADIEEERLLPFFETMGSATVLLLVSLTGWSCAVLIRDIFGESVVSSLFFFWSIP